MYCFNYLYPSPTGSIPDKRNSLVLKFTGSWMLRQPENEKEVGTCFDFLMDDRFCLRVVIAHSNQLQ